ncbi:MAG: sigma-54 dependent transcriptional regulator [Candidatus Sumerlaeaceae bacterium]|nr:sigma-54 dependent transcriptional regulator [Candidatus Sumerlaeaceae bacterium]
MSATGRTEPQILIAEDEDRLRRLMEMLLAGKGYGLTLARDGAEAWRHFQAGPFDLVITDIRMPEMDGMELLRRIKERSAETPVMVITAFGSIESAVEAMQAGAIDYATKPFESDRFLLAIERALSIRKILSENQTLRREVREKYNLDGIVAESPGMRHVLETVRQVAAATTTVLVTGESGTGKELVTRAVHDLSPRRSGPFVAINCAAIPEQLLESELFGHEKGSFTGATERKAGRFEIASGGTLFLDEIGEMSPAIQAKVLRAIETQEIERVGGNKTIKTDIRFIAATNRDLSRAVAEGSFRNDLFFRINVFPIHIPPLRQRREDIVPLAMVFVKKFCAQMGKHLPTLSPKAAEALLAHPWCGNVRELQNQIERAAIMLTGDILTEAHLGITTPNQSQTFPTQNPELRTQNAFVIPDTGFSLEDHERSLLLQALERSRGNKTRAARLLGVSRATLRYRLEKFGLEANEAVVADA